MPISQEIHCDNDNGYADQGQEYLNGFRLPEKSWFSFDQCKKDDSEMDTGGKHRQCQDNFRSGIIIESDACITVAKTARAAG